MYSLKSRLLNIPTLGLSILLLVLAWLPIAFVGFHPHHDGLMLATIRLQKEALLNGGPYPFNQYGSFWSFPYLLSALALPDQYILVASRITTLVMYTLSAIFTWKIAKNVSNPRVAYLSIFVLLLSHPYGLEPMPWPSSTQLFLFSMISYMSVSLFKSSDIAKNSLNKWSPIPIGIGALVAMSLFTRLQVGLLLAMFYFVFFLLIREFKYLRDFALGLLAFILFWSFLLSTFGWLKDSLIDEFQFGFMIAGNDQTDKPFPLWTLIFTAGILGIYSLSILISQKSKNKVFIRKGAQVLSCTFLLLFLLFLFSIISNPSKISSRVEFITGKFWVSTLLATVFLYILQSRKTLSAIILRNPVSLSQKAIIILVCLSAISEFQIYPLFDPMHSWWASIPTIILIAIVIDKFLMHLDFSPIPIFRITAKLIPLALVSATLLPYSIALTSPSSPLLPDKIFGTRIGPGYSLSEAKTQDFFHSFIDSSHSVLNLCPDANLFFTSDFKSASRYFLYWTIMNDFEPAQRAISSSNPDRIVYCQTKGVTVDSGIKNIYNSLMPNAKVLGRSQVDLNQEIIVLGD